MERQRCKVVCYYAIIVRLSACQLASDGLIIVRRALCRAEPSRAEPDYEATNQTQAHTSTRPVALERDA